MTNELQHPIDTGPGGDSVKTAFEKEVGEFIALYNVLNTLLQEISGNFHAADVDTVDDKHADGTPNNIALVNAGGKLGYDVTGTAAHMLNVPTEDIGGNFWLEPGDTISETKLYYRANSEKYPVSLYQNIPFDTGSATENLAFRVNIGGTQTMAYARLVPVGHDKASFVRVRYGGTIRAIASDNGDLNKIFAIDIMENWEPRDTWVTTPGETTITLGEATTVDVSFDCWMYVDDGPTTMGARVLIDGVTPFLEYTFPGRWNSGSGSGYTVTEAIWQQRYAENRLWRNGVQGSNYTTAPKTGSIELAAGQHTFQIQVYASEKWPRARTVRDRSVVITL